MQDIIHAMSQRDLNKAALRGEPSYVWRAGQQRRLGMIVNAAGERLKGMILENGCGVGMYVEHLSPFGGTRPRSADSIPTDFQRCGRIYPASLLDVRPDPQPRGDRTRAGRPRRHPRNDSCFATRREACIVLPESRLPR